MGQILVDTNIISVAYLARPPAWVWEWLSILPRGSLAVSFVVIYETEYGIRNSQRNNPRRAIELLAWFEEFLSSRMVQPDMNVATGRLLGAMAAHPPLKRFFHTPEKRDKLGNLVKQDRINLGCDPMLAAIAIAHQIPIATLNPKDFCEIHRHFPIPGIYDPKADIWYVDPPAGWHLHDPANDDELSPAWPVPNGRR